MTFCAEIGENENDVACNMVSVQKYVTVMKLKKRVYIPYLMLGA